VLTEDSPRADFEFVVPGVPVLRRPEMAGEAGHRDDARLGRAAAETDAPWAVGPLWLTLEGPSRVGGMKSPVTVRVRLWDVLAGVWRPVGTVESSGMLEVDDPAPHVAPGTGRVRMQIEAVDGGGNALSLMDLANWMIVDGESPCWTARINTGSPAPSAREGADVPVNGAPGGGSYGYP
jgi:hypothetical protein